MTTRRSGDHPGLKMVNPTAAAIDIGSTMQMAAVTPDADIMPVCAFGTFTQDLHDLADWLRSCSVTSAAMEPTGVYWIPAFEILEAHGFEAILMNARDAKPAMPRMCRVAKRTSATRDGYGSCIPMVAPWPFPPRGQYRHPACLHAVKGTAHRVCRRAYLSPGRAACAESTDGDEPATASCRLRYHKRDGHADHPSHRWGPA